MDEYDTDTLEGNCGKPIRKIKPNCDPDEVSEVNQETLDQGQVNTFGTDTLEGNFPVEGRKE